MQLDSSIASLDESNKFVKTEPPDLIKEEFPPAEDTTLGVAGKISVQLELQNGDVDYEMLTDGSKFECVSIFTVDLIKSKLYNEF